MSELYDSAPETCKHIERVRELMTLVSDRLIERAKKHDGSKLEPHEKEIFDIYTPKLKGTTYGSDEYKEYLTEMDVALKHHYANNRHHPEHFLDGINEMNLIDLIEMLCDWKAATERHANGSISDSLIINKERFGIDNQLSQVLKTTCRDLGWGM
jgi:hypothetical protein